MKTNMVRKSNSVIEACYDMTVPELRLIYACISKIDFKQVIDKEEMFFITAKEYANTFDVDMSNSHKELHKAVEDIWDRDITIKREGETDLITRWISSKANWGNGEAQIRFAYDVIPYLTELLELGSFTMYQLENIASLKSTYSIRFYELLKQYEKIGSRKITLKKIYEIFKLGSKYKEIRDLKKRVIDLAIKEINENTDIYVTYENIKRGRRIVAFNFIIQSKIRKEAEKKPKKKYLTAAELDKKGKIGESYPELYARLKKEGYTFEVKKNY